MTFPFSGEFKFKLLKATREDDMTSSTIKNLNEDICIEFLAFPFVFLRATKCREMHSVKQKKAEEHDPQIPGHFECYLQPQT